MTTYHPCHCCRPHKRYPAFSYYNQRPQFRLCRHRPFFFDASQPHISPPSIPGGSSSKSTAASPSSAAPSPRNFFLRHVLSRTRHMIAAAVGVTRATQKCFSPQPTTVEFIGDHVPRHAVANLHNRDPPLTSSLENPESPETLVALVTTGLWVQ